MQMQTCYSTKYPASSLCIIASKHFLHVMKLVDATAPDYTTAIIALGSRLLVWYVVVFHNMLLQRLLDFSRAALVVLMLFFVIRRFCA